MIQSPHTRRRAEAFARALDGGAEPDAASRSLVTLARALPQPPVTMSTASRERVRRRLLAVAAVQSPGNPQGAPTARSEMGQHRKSRGQSRLALVTGMVTVVLLVFALVAIGGNRALPGEPLYRVKSLAEAVQLAATFGDVDRGKRHLAFAATRVREVDALVTQDRAGAAGPNAVAPLPRQPVAASLEADGPPSALVVDTLRRMAEQTVAGTKDLTEAWRSSGDEGPLRYLNGYSRQQFSDLRAILTMLPVGAKPVAARSMALLVIVNNRADWLQKVSCTVRCRHGSRAGGSGVTIASDPLGAIPCLGTCTLATSVAELTMPAEPVTSATETMGNQLDAILETIPPTSATTASPDAGATLPLLPPTTSPPAVGGPTPPGDTKPDPGSSPTTEVPLPPDTSTSAPSGSTPAPSTLPPSTSAPTPAPTSAPTFIPSPAPSPTPSTSDPPPVRHSDHRRPPDSGAATPSQSKAIAGSAATYAGPAPQQSPVSTVASGS